MDIGPPPLAGIKVLEFAGLAPGPYAGMLLADAGASVLRVDRPGTAPTADPLTRRKASIAVDVGGAGSRGAALVRELVRAAGVDVLIDPFRPGVLERLGLGPDALLRLNPRLVYARLTGFRRDGRYRDMAGHDINYLAVSGALAMLGRARDTPHAPMNLLADFAGGGATLVQGVLLALLARHASGRGQVVEANMVDGSAHLATFPRLLLPTPLGDRGRGRNLLDGACPYYDTYETSDGRYMSVGALEPRFFRRLVDGLALADDDAAREDRRRDPRHWPALRRRIADAFRRRTRAEWERVFDGSDACCLPVLDYAELRADPSREGDQRPAVALRRTPCLAIARPAPRSGPADPADPAVLGQGPADPADPADPAVLGQGPADPADPAVLGQGPGAPGDGYDADLLAPGQGADRVLESWLGWKRGIDYHVGPRGFVLSDHVGSKL
ncbi:hypothetical protein G6O67_003757 [Ophiocordyceps sinensis]|uniref:Alpha-methylacyl-CoA racemase n=1 Tax=Ophiocordyceps sinensis TaxID=72228 RepID=A0A8H4V6L3_9HYPO|nr:hypothetical protein G6O67_003757 [Ophiocordyceps sinensis]